MKANTHPTLAMKIARATALTALLSGLISTTWAQTAPASPPPAPGTAPASATLAPSTGPVVSPRLSAAEAKAYRLDAEDGLMISVANFANLSCQVTVQPDGKITVPMLGDVKVTGQTPPEVATMLTTRWKKFVINPSVTVTLAQKRPVAGVVFYGFANRAGTVPFRPNLRLSQALAEVGGVSLRGDATQLVVMHRSGEKLTSDMSHPESAATQERDVALEEGDIVFVPERRAQISVLGEVNRPGSIEHREDMKVLDALGAAVGTKETADLKNATLMHDGKETPLDLDALLRHGDTSLNVTLMPGDRLMIPEKPETRTYVFGAVGRPGYYSYKPGDRLVDALKDFSLSQNASLTNVVVTRVDKTNNTARVQEVNLEKFLKKGETKENVALEPGDIIFVSDKRRKFGIQDFFGLATGLNLIDSTVRILGGGLGGR